MKATKELNDLFIKNPKFIFDIVHTQFLKTITFDYYEYAVMNILHEMKINEDVKFKLMSHFNVLSHKFENNEYSFTFEEDWLGISKVGKFYPLWCSILKHGYGGINVKDLFSKFYLSNDSRLIKFAEDLKKWHPNHSEDLFKIVSMEECSYSKNLQLTELLDSKWDFRLLALNEKVWQSAFEPQLNFFQPLKNQINSIHIGEYSKESHSAYVKNVNMLIQRLF
jgi:hypothetical protein